MRSNPLYYLNPNLVSITPNANELPDDLAVYIQAGTKIRARCEKVPGLGYVNESYQEWTISGRNRRLNTTTAAGTTYTHPFSIFARLKKNDHNSAYLVFAKQTHINGEMFEVHPTVTEDGILPGKLIDGTVMGDDPNYWFIKLGEVSSIEDGKRTVTLDTGILGTDQYNNEWQVIEAQQPYRVVISNNKQDSDPPYVRWGDSIQLTASLIKGWDVVSNDAVDHWTITRDTGNRTSDTEWNRTHSLNASRQITLQHRQTGTDDFDAAVAAVFTLKAWGLRPSESSDGEEETVELASESLTVLAETMERYELELSTDVMHYSPQMDIYLPAEGIKVRVRRFGQNGTVSTLTKQDILRAGLTLTKQAVTPSGSSSDSSDYGDSSDSSDYYDSSDSSDYEEYYAGENQDAVYDDFQDASGDETEVQFSTDGTATLHASSFFDQHSILLRLKFRGSVIDRKTVAFVQDGTKGDSGAHGGNTASIFLYRRSATPLTASGISQKLYYKFSERRLFTDSACTTPVMSVNEWTPVIPNGTSPLYVTTAIAFSPTDTDDIEQGEWVAPAVMSENGADGGHGVNTATVFIYKRSATPVSASDKPSDVYYCFADGKLYVGGSQSSAEATTQLNGWQREIPEGSTPCYVRQAAALGTGDFDLIAAGDWSTATKMVENGIDGAAGVTYRCRWRLSGAEVSTLTANAAGKIKNVDPLDANLNATLMKRVGDGTEFVVQGSGRIVFSFGTGQVKTTHIFNNDMSANLPVPTSPADLQGTKRITVAFIFSDGDMLTYSIDKVFDGERPVITIGDNGNWIVDGEDTGKTAEGKDGNGVELKGSVDLYETPDRPDPSESSEEEEPYIDDSSDSSDDEPEIDDSSDSSDDVPTSLQGLTGMEIGDCWVVNENRHIYFYNGVGEWPFNWNDLGEFRGEDGESSYMHIAYATNITFAPDGVTPDSATDFTTSYGRDFDWIGFCTDNNEADPTTFQSYKWHYQKGKDGDGYEYVYIRAKEETVPSIDESDYVDASGTHHRTDDEFLPAVGNYSADMFASARFTDDPQGVSEQWPCEYQSVRKKANGAWQAFSSATLHRKYGTDGKDAYSASLDTEMAVVHVTGDNVPTKAQTFYAVVSLRKGDTVLTPSVVNVKRNGTSMTKTEGAQEWKATGLTVTFSGGVITIAYSTRAHITGGVDRLAFVIASTEGNIVLFSAEMAFTVTAIGNDQYSLLPSTSQVLVQRTTGGYLPATFSLTCGCMKVDIDSQATKTDVVTGLIDGMYNLYFRFHHRETVLWDSAYHMYRIFAAADAESSDSSDEEGMLEDISAAEYDAVEFVLSKNTSPVVGEQNVTGQVASVSVPVLSNGSVGATGPSPYYLGEWLDETDAEYIPNGTAIQATDYERPYISYKAEGAEPLYYIYIGEDVLTTSTTRNHPANDPTHWQVMQSQNKYIISRAVFSQFAQFGGSIFNEDWQISANGKIAGRDFQRGDMVSGKTFGGNDFSIRPYVLFDI